MIILPKTQDFLDKFGFVPVKDHEHFASLPPVSEGTRYVEILADGSYSEILKNAYCPPNKVSLLINQKLLYATRGKEPDNVQTQKRKGRRE